ncbi:hypothetical protein [Pseudonocardia kunmingensis]|uniref:Uncharacterized protein n=1 Tax=Pseudonocardia kunmingensis TaxID=630975 RepID=A0A543DWH2_9PSEU|nr:hypothetical protein [Pseudonocardia kunmingensis]TQM13683.1 hypothetical protein FB558_0436 [Pseudonocardia kunmingensis]
MEPPVPAHATRLGAPATITVAELLARCAAGAGPARAAAVPGSAISVTALLRREGRGPHTADRPLQPRGRDRLVDATPPRRSVRKATAAAGALFAATAVVGSTLVDNAVRHSAPAPALGAPLSDAAGAASPGPSRLALSADPADGATFAGVRQLFAEVVPSELDAPLLASAAASVHLPSTPSGARDGSTGPAATPGTGTVPPGGPGTPPGGTPLAPSSGAGGSPTTPGLLAGPPGAPGGPRGVPAVPGGPPGAPAVPGAPGNPPGAPGGGAAPGGPGGGTGVAPTPGDLTTPQVHVPTVGAEVPVVGPVRTPAVTLGPARVAPPALSAAVAPDEVAVATSGTGVDVPDLAVSGAAAGPLATSATGLRTPDVALSGAGIALDAETGPELTVPGAAVSGTRLQTPDVTLGPATVPLPDVELPAVELPATTVGGDDALADTVEGLGRGVGGADEEDEENTDDAGPLPSRTSGDGDSRTPAETDASGTTSQDTGIDIPQNDERSDDGEPEDGERVAGDSGRDTGEGDAEDSDENTAADADGDAEAGTDTEADTDTDADEDSE